MINSESELKIPSPCQQQISYKLLGFLNFFKPFFPSSYGDDTDPTLKTFYDIFYV